MRFATWNLKYCGTEGARRRVEFLSSHDLDVIALQEVSWRAWEVITENGIAESGFYTLDGFGVTPLGERPHGAALLASNGFQLSAARVILGLPKVERALVARTTVEDAPVTVASWLCPWLGLTRQRDDTANGVSRR